MVSNIASSIPSRVTEPLLHRAQTDPSPKSRKPGSVIKRLAERLEMHRLRDGNRWADLSQFARQAARVFQHRHTCHPACYQSLRSLRQKRARPSPGEDARASTGAIAPSRNGRLACARRGLGLNLNRGGVSDVVIQRILRHSNVPTTLACYAKSSGKDVKRR